MLLAAFSDEEPMAKWDEEITFGWTNYKHSNGFVPWTWICKEETANKEYRPEFAFFCSILPPAVETVPWTEPEPLVRPPCLHCSDSCTVELDDDDFLCLACKKWASDFKEKRAKKGK
jgi:hypothetical protein